jgi:hypothetical protein
MFCTAISAKVVLFINLLSQASSVVQIILIAIEISNLISICKAFITNWAFNFSLVKQLLFVQASEKGPESD